MQQSKKLLRAMACSCLLSALAACSGGGDPPTSSRTQPHILASSATAVAPIDARPNDGSGYWPDFSNTGYKNTPANAGGLGLPAYPGQLEDYAPDMTDTGYTAVEYPDNSVIAYKHFRGKVGIYGDNLTFVGCLFEGTQPNDNLVQVYSNTHITFLYSTFKPGSLEAPPGNDGTVSSAHNSPGTPFDQSWQMATTMMSTAVVLMDHNDIWGNAGMEMTTGFPGRPSVWTNNYIHDQSDTANFVYHHDGIGPSSDDGNGPMIIDHNTIASLGNTNALALQGPWVYDHISFTNNYVSGWGYALHFGDDDNATNITVTGNVFSTELSEIFAPNYGNYWGGTARGSTWRNNQFQVRNGDDNKQYTTAAHGKYWWPDNTAHDVDYAN